MRTDHFFYHIYEDLLKWFMGTLVFSTLHYRDFSFLKFLFSFLCAHKKHKNANKRISDCFPLTCFLSACFIFVCLFAFCIFAWLRFCAFGAFLCFWCFFVLFGAFFVLFMLFCACEIFLLKNKKFKTALIISFVLTIDLVVHFSLT